MSFADRHRYRHYGDVPHKSKLAGKGAARVGWRDSALHVDTGRMGRGSCLEGTLDDC